MAGATNIGKWSVQASVDASGFSAGTQQIVNDSKKTESALSRLKNSAFAIGVTAAAIGLLKLEDAIKGYVKAGMDAVRMQDRLAHAIGVTPGSAAAMMAVNAAAGGSPEELQSASLRALRHIGELREDLAGGGTGGAAGASLRSLGIDPGQFAAMTNFSQQLGLISDRMRNVSSAADRAAIAHAIFGRGFESLMPQLRIGSEGMERYSRWAEHFGAVASGDARDGILGTARAARDFNIAQQLAGEGLRTQFTTGYQLATAGARNYAEATQRLIELQPELASAARDAGSALGTILGGVESAAVKVLAFWNRIFDLFRTPSGSPEAVSGLRDRIHSTEAIMRVANRELLDVNARRNAATGEERDRLNEEYFAVQRRYAGLQVLLDDLQSQLPAAATAWEDATEEDFLGMMATNQQALTNAIAESTAAIERQNNAYGMSADELKRLAFIQQGATAADLARFDAAVAQQQQLAQATRDRAQAESEMARTRQMVEAARSPFDVLQARLRQIDNAGLTAEQRGRLIRAALPQMGAAPLLGGLSAGSTEAGAIIQDSMAQQTNISADTLSVLESMRDAADEARDANVELADMVREFLAS